MTDLSATRVVEPPHNVLWRWPVSQSARLLEFLLRTAANADARHQHRQNLLQIDDRTLADIGRTRADLEDEVRRTS